MTGNIGHRQVGIDIKLAGICGQRRARGKNKAHSEQGKLG
jgi:hypothetical protein